MFCIKYMYLNYICFARMNTRRCTFIFIFIENWINHIIVPLSNVGNKNKYNWILFYVTCMLWMAFAFYLKKRMKQNNEKYAAHNLYLLSLPPPSQVLYSTKSTKPRTAQQNSIRLHIPPFNEWFANKINSV